MQLLRQCINCKSVFGCKDNGEVIECKECHNSCVIDNRLDVTGGICEDCWRNRSLIKQNAIYGEIVVA